MKPIPPKSVRAVSHSSPKGRADLRIREWRCVECTAFHENRDVNPALNILALGHERIAVGLPTFRSGGCQKRTHNYDTTGRIQNESESDEDSEQLIKFLKDNNIKHKNVNSHTLLSAYISYEIINTSQSFTI